jgi:hypothetical protein
LSSIFISPFHTTLFIPRVLVGFSDCAVRATTLPHAFIHSLRTTAILSPIIINRTRTVSFNGDTQPVRKSIGLEAMTTETKRRRRSSSLVFTEPPESLEHKNDQAVLPNLNAEWVNAKGEFVKLPTLCCPLLTAFKFRRMAHTSHPYYMPQDLLRHLARHLSGTLMDSHKHILHDWFLHNVPLGARHTVRL